MSKSRMVVRSPVWLGASWLLGLLWLGVGIAIVSESWDAGGLVLGVVVFVMPGIVVVCRLPFMRVEAGPGGIVVHGLLRSRLIAWGDVIEVRLVPLEDRMFWRAYAPAVVLRDSSDVEVLTLLAGYSAERRVPVSRMARQAAALERHRRRLASREPGQ